MKKVIKSARAMQKIDLRYRRLIKQLGDDKLCRELGMTKDEQADCLASVEIQLEGHVRMMQGLVAFGPGPCGCLPN